MYGYTITINGKVSAKEKDIVFKNIICSNNMIKKFEQDKVFAETEEYIIVLDGIILNSKELTSKYDLGGGIYVYKTSFSNYIVKKEIRSSAN